ncbi:hypothetical protein F5050DRAFT_1789278 [Lentinula boryana]|uniref:Uncharacterized protein n=1 Tax=Lentinula boryana TaxID=40481 RepID=A0ABQ8Q1N3_9AGAR|nr:hypothetical protein F5050DRAFT_1789278 [Lentinula boryana]
MNFPLASLLAAMIATMVSFSWATPAYDAVLNPEQYSTSAWTPATTSAAPEFLKRDPEPCIYNCGKGTCRCEP